MGKAIKKSRAGVEFEDLLSKLRICFEAEYQRGISNAAKDILAAVNGGAKQKVARKPFSSTKAPKLKKIRSPRGGARLFLQKILHDEKLTIKEMLGKARTSEEKLLSYQTIRLELERGKAEGLYKKMDGGTWSI